MSAAQNRFKQANAPLGGSDDTQCGTWGPSIGAAQNRFKQANALLGGSDDTQCGTWGPKL